MEGRPTLLCFAVDVTERNTLRREFLEATKFGTPARCQ
jgi:hypothetical protein